MDATSFFVMGIGEKRVSYRTANTRIASAPRDALPIYQQGGMYVLTFRFSGADGCMTETETLTSGMVGKEVKFEFSRDWEGLTKTAVFTAGYVTRSVVGVSDCAVIPAAVLEYPLQRLYVGIYGTSPEGRVTPTIRAEGPEILPGVKPWAYAGTDPELPVWAQLQAQIDELKNGSGNSVANAGLTEEQIAALNGMFSVCAYIKSDVSAEYGDFKAAFGTLDAALTGISVVYSGGDVPAGTSLEALSGIAVTAHYSDGGRRTITDYVLSGTVGEGSNTITVTYEGMTASFTVTGISDAVTLTGITASYTGGTVPVGTPLTDLTGIVVTAHYSDGSAASVSGYTLSGTIAQGENTITVTYGGKTAVFTVTGAAEDSEVVLEPVATGEFDIQTSAITEGAVPGTVLLNYKAGMNGGVFALEAGKTYEISGRAVYSASYPYPAFAIIDSSWDMVLPTTGNVNVSGKVLYVPVVPSDHPNAATLTATYTATEDCYAVAWGNYSVIQK